MELKEFALSKDMLLITFHDGQFDLVCEIDGLRYGCKGTPGIPLGVVHTAMTWLRDCWLHSGGTDIHSLPHDWPTK